MSDLTPAIFKKIDSATKNSVWDIQGNKFFEKSCLIYKVEGPCLVGKNNSDIGASSVSAFGPGVNYAE